jgi:predicted nucleic acid-binding protein
MSNPNYARPHRFSAAQIIDQLSDFVRATDHEFWPDDISIRDQTRFQAERIHGPRQLTDIYLLSLAAKHDCRLVTFDTGIDAAAAQTASLHNLCIL